MARVGNRVPLSPGGEENSETGKREREGRTKFSDIEDESFPSKESCYESDETWKLIALSEANSPPLEIYLEGIENETGRLWILHETGLFSKSLKVNPLAGTTSASRGSRVNFTILTSRWNRIINDHYTMNFFPLPPPPSSKNIEKRVKILKAKFTNRSRLKNILYFFVFVIFRCTKNEKYLDFDFFLPSEIFQSVFFQSLNRFLAMTIVLWSIKLFKYILKFFELMELKVYIWKIQDILSWKNLLKYLVHCYDDVPLKNIFLTKI